MNRVAPTPEIAPADPPADWPSAQTARITLVLLMAAAIVSQLDRQIISLVVEPLKAEFKLSDTQFAALQSVAFGLFYASMTVPIGMLADRWQRRAVVGVGIALFSVFSISSGFARNYAQLFLARMGVGVGEASVYPPGYSLVADTFPPERLGRAMSLFTASSMIGSGLAYVGGGALIGGLTWLGAKNPELLFGLEPWQLAFVGVALPGVLLAPCFLALREPARRGLAAMRKPSTPLGLLLGEVWRLRGFLAPMLAGFSMVTMVSYSLGVWAPAVFIRVYHWSPARIGICLGVLYLVFATAGGYLAGWMTDRLRARGVVDAPLKVAAWGFLGCGVTAGLSPLASSPYMALALLAPTLLFQAMPYACAPTAIQLIVPNQVRAQVGALYLMIITLVGLGAGPVIVGAFTDHLFRAPSDVQYSLALLVACAAPVMTVFVLLSCRAYRRLAADPS